LLQWEDENFNSIVVEFSSDEPPIIYFNGTDSVQFFDMDSFYSLHIGMSREEVLSIMEADPTGMQKEVSPAGSIRSIISWETGNVGNLSVFFVDDSVVSKEHFQGGSY
jgi:hypothetical protein